jgi:hypothetical protein
MDWIQETTATLLVRLQVGDRSRGKRSTLSTDSVRETDCDEVDSCAWLNLELNGRVVKDDDEQIFGMLSKGYF